MGRERTVAHGKKADLIPRRQACFFQLSKTIEVRGCWPGGPPSRPAFNPTSSQVSVAQFAVVETELGSAGRTYFLIPLVLTIAEGRQPSVAKTTNRAGETKLHRTNVTRWMTVRNGSGAVIGPEPKSGHCRGAAEGGPPKVYWQGHLCG